MPDYSKIFKPETLANLKGKSAQSLRQMVGNKSVMNTLMSSMRLLREVNQIERPYIDELEMIAEQIAKDAYPVIEYADIKIDAKLTDLNGVKRELSESQQQFTPEFRRRIINGITQGSAVRGTFGFLIFREYLDQLDPTTLWYD